MTWTKSGNLVSLTGTEANLSALSAISGVSMQTAGDFTFYFLGSNDRLSINGSLTIDPRVEMLVTRWNGNNSTPGIHIGGNATLTIGRGITSTTSSQDPAPESFGAGTGLVIAANGPQCCDDGSIDVRGTLEMFNSTIKTRGVMEWNNGCTVRIRNGTIVNTDPSNASPTNNTRIRINEGENIDIIGLTTFNMQLDYLTDEAFENFEGLLAQDIAIGVENGFQTIGAQRVWRAVPDYGATSQAFASNFDCLKDLRIINSARGSDTVLVPDRSNGTHFNTRRNRVTVTTTAQAAGNLTTLNVANSTGIAAGQRLRIGDNNNGFIRVVASVTTGVITLTEDTPSAQPSNTVVSNVTAYGGRIFHELNVSVVDAAGTGIENAKVYIRDTDHGNRIETDSAGDIDETDDRTYEETTNAQGVADTMTVLTGMWYRQDRVGDIAAPNGNEICDVRGKNNTRGEDLFDIQVWSYPHLPFEVRDVRLNGTAAVNQTVALLADALITETNQTTVSAYTELDTAAKAYDYVKDQIYDNFAGETEMPLSREGTTLTFTTTRNITLAATGATPFSSDANSITIVTGATFNGNLRSSNSTITVPAGVSVSGFVTDTAGTASTVQVRPASGDYTVTLFAADGTQRGTGTGDQDFALTPTQAEAGMKVVCQRAGYGSEVRTLDTSAGGVFTVSFAALRQHLLPNGSVMLGTDLSSEVSVAFVLTDLTDVQSRIDVGDLFVSAPVLYNEFDAALATDDGRKFLAFGGSQITIDIDPVSGNKVYLNASGNKLRRAAAGDNNSGVNSTIYHPDNQPVDDANGSVQINAGIDTAILARTLFVDVDIDTTTAGHNSVLSLLQSADTNITDIVAALVGADWDPSTAGTQTLNDITAAIATQVLSIQGDVESTTHGLAAIRTAVGSGGGGGGGGGNAPSVADIVAGIESRELTNPTMNLLFVVDENDRRMYTYTLDGTRLINYEFDLAGANSHATGATYHDNTFYIADWTDGHVYAHDWNGNRVSSKDFALHSSNATARGITYDDNKFWVLDSSVGQIFVYSADGTRDTSSEFTLHSTNTSSQDVIAYNNKLYVTDATHHKFFVYNQDGTRDASSEFDFHTNNNNATGAAFAQGSFYVIDSNDRKAYAYSVSGTRQEDKDIDFHTDNAHAQGAAFMLTVSLNFSEIFTILRRDLSALPRTSQMVTALQAADFGAGSGVQTLAAVLASIKTVVDGIPTNSAPSTSDIVTAIQGADFGEAAGTQNLRTILASIKNAIDAIPTENFDGDVDLSSVEGQLTSTTHGLSAIKTAIDGLPTPATTSEIVTSISNADFGSASGTQTLQTILGNIVTNVTPLPDLEKLLKVCAAILGGKAVYTESTSTVVFRDVEDTIDAVTIVYGSGEGDRNTVTLHPNLQ